MLCWIFIRKHGRKLNKIYRVQVMQKADSNSSAGAGDDSQQKAEVTSASQHSIKPLVVGLPSLSDNIVKLKSAIRSDEIIQECLSTDDYVGANERIQKLKTIYSVPPFVDGSLVQPQNYSKF